MKITSHRVFYDYNIFEKFEAGIHLTGPEVKSVKGGHVSLEGAFCRIIGSEAYLINAQIFPYPHARVADYEPGRTRKLLLHKKELMVLKSKMQQANLTLIPLSCYNKQGFIKIEIALAKAKKLFEKREALKRKDIDRATEEEIRGKF